MTQLKGDPKTGDYVDQVINELSRLRPKIDLRTSPIAGRLMQASLYFDDSMCRVSSAHGLALGEGAVLTQLLLSGVRCSLPLSQLVKKLWMTPAGITKQVERLTQLRLVTKTKSATDNRVIFATLTQQGRRVAYSLITAQHSQIETLSILELTEYERNQLARLLRKLMLTLERNVPTRPGNMIRVDLSRVAHARLGSANNKHRRERSP
jgi:DNA-binding MarR family transcriptional regulator